MRINYKSGRRHVEYGFFWTRLSSWHFLLWQTNCATEVDRKSERTENSRCCEKSLLVNKCRGYWITSFATFHHILHAWRYSHACIACFSCTCYLINSHLAKLITILWWRRLIHTACISGTCARQNALLFILKSSLTSWVSSVANVCCTVPSNLFSSCNPHRVNFPCYGENPSLCQWFEGPVVKGVEWLSSGGTHLSLLAVWHNVFDHSSFYIKQGRG